MFLGPEALVFVKPGTGHTGEGPSDSSAANGSETAPNWERRPVGFGADAFEGPRDGAISPEKERKQQPESQSTIPLRLDQELVFHPQRGTPWATALHFLSSWRTFLWVQ